MKTPGSGRSFWAGRFPGSGRPPPEGRFLGARRFPGPGRPPPEGRFLGARRFPGPGRPPPEGRFLGARRFPGPGRPPPEGRFLGARRFPGPGRPPPEGRFLGARRFPGPGRPPPEGRFLGARRFPGPGRPPPEGRFLGARRFPGPGRPPPEGRFLGARRPPPEGRFLGAAVQFPPGSSVIASGPPAFSAAARGCRRGPAGGDLPAPFWRGAGRPAETCGARMPIGGIPGGIVGRGGRAEAAPRGLLPEVRGPARRPRARAGAPGPPPRRAGARPRPRAFGICRERTVGDASAHRAHRAPGGARVVVRRGAGAHRAPAGAGPRGGPSRPSARRAPAAHPRHVQLVPPPGPPGCNRRSPRISAASEPCTAAVANRRALSVPTGNRRQESEAKSARGAPGGPRRGGIPALPASRARRRAARPRGGAPSAAAGQRT